MIDDERRIESEPALPARRLARELAMKVFFEADLTDRPPAELFERYRTMVRYGVLTVVMQSASSPQFSNRLRISTEAGGRRTRLPD